MYANANVIGIKLTIRDTYNMTMTNDNVYLFTFTIA